MTRNFLYAFLLGGVAIVAGCTSPSATDGGHGAGVETKEALLAAYTFQPFTAGAQALKTPEHTWLKLDEKRLQFIHWDHADPVKAKGPLFVGDGVKANFCFGAGGISRADYDAGYVHFHNANAANWDAGHNNGGVYSASVSGWWLRHIGAVDATMQMMGDTMTIQKGKVFLLMPADASKVAACPVGHDHEKNLGAQLRELYVDTPFSTTDDRSEHNTPNHVWRILDANTLQFLHWDTEDVSKATTLLFVGDGFRASFCVGAGGISQAQYDAGYVHFHSAVAENWDAGHNNGGVSGSTVQGWWLRHIGAVDMSMEMMGESMTIEKGAVFPMMPANLANVAACA